jgi:hypothetical protein
MESCRSPGTRKLKLRPRRHVFLLAGRFSYLSARGMGKSALGLRFNFKGIGDFLLFFFPNPLLDF